MTTKQKWAVLGASSLAIILALIFFWFQPPKPLVAFRLMDPPAHDVGPNDIQWQIAIINLSHSKEIDGEVELERKETNGKISKIALRQSSLVFFNLAPGQSLPIGPTTSRGSKDEFRVIIQFYALTTLEENIYQKLRVSPLIGRFVPTPKLQIATSEWFRTPSLPLTNGLSQYAARWNYKRTSKQ